MPDRAKGANPVKQLLVIGFGYCGRAIADAARHAGWDVRGTTRRGEPGLIDFAAVPDSLNWASHVLMTAPPGPAGDPLLGTGIPDLQWHGRWVGYLSTTGVYGDRNGGWVDAATPPAPQSDRSRARLAAERAWAGLAAQGAAVDVFRLGGIYGPGRSVLDDLWAGTARRIVKPGHSFSRIHRGDIVQAVLVAMMQPAGTRIFDLVDDLPAAQADVVEYAAQLLNIPPPPPEDFDAITLSPMARSFWVENRRVSSAATKRALGIDWRYPSYREGLCSIKNLIDQPAQNPA